MKTDKWNLIFSGIFGNVRLDIRMQILFAGMVNHGSAIINRNSKDEEKKMEGVPYDEQSQT